MSGRFVNVAVEKSSPNKKQCRCSPLSAGPHTVGCISLASITFNRPTVSKYTHQAKNIPVADRRALPRVSDPMFRRRYREYVPQNCPQVSRVAEETPDIRRRSGSAGTSAYHQVPQYETSEHNVSRRTHGTRKSYLQYQMTARKSAGFRR
jgi:hypothetical protein